jgi:hypothetical protein
MIKIILKNTDTGREIDYKIRPMDHLLSRDWQVALDEILQRRLILEKTFCFLGFPNTPRNLEYLCDRLNKSIYEINTFDWKQQGLSSYRIEDYFSSDVVRFGPEYFDQQHTELDMIYHDLKHEPLNRLHHHFEILQGTVENPSKYFLAATPRVRSAIGVLNTVCHEIESLVLSQRKHMLLPEWTRPSQITSFRGAPRYELNDQHRELFLVNQYDRRLGTVYMHWAQIGKTLFEVFRDEHAPALDAATCSAITHLQYYSGEFDIEWGRDVARGTYVWHDKQMNEFYQWLITCGFDPNDPKLSLGYLPIAQVDLKNSFGTDTPEHIWSILGDHLNIHRIETKQHSMTYDYTWRDQDA